MAAGGSWAGCLWGELGMGARMQKSLGRCWPGSQLEWSQPLSPGGWDPTLLVPSTHGHSRLLASEPAARYPVPSKHMERMGLDLCGWPHPKLLIVSICKHARDGPGAVSDHVCICVCGGHVCGLGGPSGGGCPGPGDRH